MSDNTFVGENYNNNKNLGIVEIAKKVRAYIKEKYPGFKFSVRTQKYSMGRSLYIDLVDIPSETKLINIEYVKQRQEAKLNITPQDWRTDEINSMMTAIEKYANSFNRTESDIQSDYYNTSFYLWMNIVGDLQNKRAKAAGLLS